MIYIESPNMCVWAHGNLKSDLSWLSVAHTCTERIENSIFAFMIRSDRLQRWKIISDNIFFSWNISFLANAHVEHYLLKCRYTRMLRLTPSEQPFSTADSSPFVRTWFEILSSVYISIVIKTQTKKLVSVRSNHPTFSDTSNLMLLSHRNE